MASASVGLASGLSLPSMGTRAGLSSPLCESFPSGCLSQGVAASAAPCFPFVSPDPCDIARSPAGLSASRQPPRGGSVSFQPGVLGYEQHGWCLARLRGPVSLDLGLSNPSCLGGSARSLDKFLLHIPFSWLFLERSTSCYKLLLSARNCNSPFIFFALKLILSPASELPRVQGRWWPGPRPVEDPVSLVSICLAVLPFTFS